MWFGMRTYRESVLTVEPGLWTERAAVPMPDVGSGVGPARLMVCKSVTQQVDVCLLGAAWRHLTTIRLNHFHERDV